MYKEYKKFLKFIGVVSILCLVYLGGYYIGHKNLQFENGYKPKVLGVYSNKAKDTNFSIFWDAWDIVKSKFVNKDVNEKEMTYGAISGMLDSLGDPYTLFMSPDEAKRFSEDLAGEFDGIGAEIENKNGYLIIVSPLKDSPAEKAGLEPQDIISKIDGEDVSKMTFYGAIDKIRGKKGSEVILTIIRKGWKEAKDIKVTRDTIVVKSVEYEIKDDNIIYLEISQFGDDTTNLVKSAVDQALQKNVRGVIIDLRNNPGGYLEDAVDITSLFIPSGVVVKEKDRNGNIKELKTTLNQKIKDIPLVVLVNGGSASASEIFAGAIQDCGRGKLIGEKTFGKGSVQNLEDLKDGSKVRVTIAKWLTPKDREIDKEGIEPDIKVELTDEDKSAGRDPQLERAMEEINK